MMANVLALRLLSHQVQQLSHQFDYSEKILMNSLSAVMANVLASSSCPLPLVPSSRHLPPFSQQLEDMFISTKGAEHWKCVPTTSQQYVPETSLNYSHFIICHFMKSLEITTILSSKIRMEFLSGHGPSTCQVCLIINKIYQTVLI